jgi:hypothetical protein
LEGLCVTDPLVFTEAAVVAKYSLNVSVKGLVTRTLQGLILGVI